jgi:hypothetical protein
MLGRAHLKMPFALRMFYFSQFLGLALGMR